MDTQRERGELALSMADMDARFGDYRDALTWLEVYAQHDRLPRSYERKRLGWIEQARSARAGLAPRSRRREPRIQPISD